MATFEEKEQYLRNQREQQFANRAQRTLESLLDTRNCEVLESRGGKPVRVAICPMAERTVWRRVEGTGTGKKCIFEIEADHD